MPRLTSLLLFFFVFFTFYDIKGWEMCTVSTRISRRNYYGRITYTSDWVLRNCTDGCCLSGCCMTNTWTSVMIFLVVISSLAFIGLAAAAIYYWKFRKPRAQYIRPVQGLTGPMQNQGVMYSPSPMYPTQPVEQPGYNPYESQIQPGSNPYGYTVPQSGAYPPSSPPYNPPMPQPPFQQQPGAYPPSAPPYNPPMPQPPFQQQPGAYPPSAPPYNPPMPQPPFQQQPGAYPPTSPPQQFHQPGGYSTPYPPPPQ